jgi:hypothetical protein
MLEPAWLLHPVLFSRERVITDGELYLTDLSGAVYRIVD